MLNKLIELLPISRRKQAELLVEITKVLNGLVEAEANHCQIETNIIQQIQRFQKNETEKPAGKKHANINRNMYG